MGYSVLALIVELNTIFLHLRQLLQTCGVPKSNQYYRLNSLINLGEYKVDLGNSSSVVECLTFDQGADGSSLTSVTVLCP